MSELLADTTSLKFEPRSQIIWAKTGTSSVAAIIIGARLHVLKYEVLSGDPESASTWTSLDQ